MAIELDDDQRFVDPGAYRHHRRKDALLQESGYVVLRFLAEDVGKSLDDVYTCTGEGPDAHEAPGALAHGLRRLHEADPCQRTRLSSTARPRCSRALIACRLPIAVLRKRWYFL